MAADQRAGRSLLVRVAWMIFWIGPPLLFMAATLWLGTGRAAGTETRSALEQFLMWLSPGWAASLPAAVFDTLNFTFRKGGHFWGYALLGAMNARAVRGLTGTLSQRQAVLPWGAAVAWSAIDEFHQSFSPSRTGTAADVCLDSAGAAAGVLIFLLWTHRRRSRSSSLRSRQP